MIRICSKPYPANIGSNAGLRVEGADQRVEQRDERVGVADDEVGSCLAHTADRPRGRVANVGARVAEQLHQSGEGLLDDRLEQLRVRSVEERAEREDGRIAQPPVGAGDVLVDEWHELRDERVLAAAGQQREAHAGRLGRIPLVLVSLLLLREELREHRHEIGQGATRVVARCVRRRASLFGRLLRLDRELRLAVAHGAPELDTLQRDARRLRLHGLHRDLLITVQSGGGRRRGREGGSGEKRKCGRKRGGRGEEENASGGGGGRGGEVKDVDVDEEKKEEKEMEEDEDCILLSIAILMTKSEHTAKRACAM